MNLLSGSAIFFGAGLGALLRWTLGHLLNPLFPVLPPGTLAANVVGALLMGIVLGVFAQYEAISPTLRLAVTTGFLGGLTTFPAFSAESTVLLLRDAAPAVSEGGQDVSVQVDHSGSVPNLMQWCVYRTQPFAM